MNYKPATKFSAGCASYIYNALYRLEDSLDSAIVKVSGVEFDTIVCTGISGIIFAVPLAQRLNKKIAIVRKDRDGTHSNNEIESNCFKGEFGRCLIVDDLVSSGATVKRIKRIVRKNSPKVKFVGVYLYNDNYFRRGPGAGQAMFN